MKRAFSTAITFWLLICTLGVVELNVSVVKAPLDLPATMPVVFVDPQNVSAAPGETFTISVKVFNLSDNFYSTDELWEQGEPLGPPGVLFNYTLGNLYGLDVQLSWDPTILEPLDRTVTIPVEHYSSGTLHKPVWDIKDEIDGTAGTYWLAKASQYPAAPFNSPSQNATVFTMTFLVMQHGACILNLDSVDLAALWRQGNTHSIEIPHWILGGRFQYPLINPYCPGDINRDRRVDIYDAVLIGNAYGSTPSAVNWNPYCDICEPYGVVDIYDAVTMCKYYGEEYTP